MVVSEDQLLEAIFTAALTFEWYWTSHPITLLPLVLLPKYNAIMPQYKGVVFFFNRAGVGRFLRGCANIFPTPPLNEVQIFPAIPFKGSKIFSAPPLWTIVMCGLFCWKGAKCFWPPPHQQGSNLFWAPPPLVGSQFFLLHPTIHQPPLLLKNYHSLTTPSAGYFLPFLPSMGIYVPHIASLWCLITHSWTNNRCPLEIYIHP